HARCYEYSSSGHGSIASPDESARSAPSRAGASGGSRESWRRGKFSGRGIKRTESGGHQATKENLHQSGSGQRGGETGFRTLDFASRWDGGISRSTYRRASASIRPRKNRSRRFLKRISNAG